MAGKDEVTVPLVGFPPAKNERGLMDTITATVTISREGIETLHALLDNLDNIASNYEDYYATNEEPLLSLNIQYRVLSDLVEAIYQGER